MSPSVLYIEALNLVLSDSECVDINPFGSPYISLLDIKKIHS